MEIDYTSQDLAVLYTCDVVVYGGSFGGVAAAVELAHSGYCVTLVEPRTYLGHEVTAMLRPWLSAGQVALGGNLLRSAVTAAAALQATGEFAFNLDALKLHLEDTLLKAGVTLLYASTLTGLQTHGGGMCGVVIGNKSGRQAIHCRLLLDTSETALAARLASDTYDAPSSGEVSYRRTLE